ncbi:hypothetical protein C8Q80DRAFT_181717 [Daedaleopsis nitida]|nr:hypothetical protein C8Q80DRAFT_181717 [Daedaleopsis nitida]
MPYYRSPCFCQTRSPLTKSTAGSTRVRVDKDWERQANANHRIFSMVTPRLSNLPLDVFYEILSLLLPMDLLNLSRTSKLITLLKTSRSAWAKALRSIPELPPRPEDMSDPSYTRTVLGLRAAHLADLGGSAPSGGY